jgi:hypothetical protein
MSTLVRTIEGKAFDLGDVSHTKLLTTGTHISTMNIFWVLLWFIMFFPVAFVVLYLKLGKKYTCVITFTRSKRVYNFDEENYCLLGLQE